MDADPAKRTEQRSNALLIATKDQRRSTDLREKLWPTYQQHRPRRVWGGAINPDD
jgi:hypothetical protein